MTMKAILLAAIGLALASCAGVSGPKGNDTGGIIPWSPENERQALWLADNNCRAYSKYARISSINRNYGDYIGYVCLFERPRRRF